MILLVMIMSSAPSPLIGIKRRISACKPEYVTHEAAQRSAELLKGFNLVEIKDVSLGAGTFFVWASNMVESCFG